MDRAAAEERDARPGGSRAAPGFPRRGQCPAGSRPGWGTLGASLLQDQEAIREEGQGRVVVESGPTTPLEVIEAQFILELRVATLVQGRPYERHGRQSGRGTGWETSLPGSCGKALSSAAAGVCAGEACTRASVFATTA